MTSASASAATQAFKIELHENGFGPDENCLICFQKNEKEESKSASGTDNTGSIAGHKITVMLSGPGIKTISDNAIVHLSCHPKQPYHHSCLKSWLQQKAICPLDRRDVNPATPTVQTAGVNKLTPTAAKVNNIAQAIFKNANFG